MIRGNRNKDVWQKVAKYSTIVRWSNKPRSSKVSAESSQQKLYCTVIDLAVFKSAMKLFTSRPLLYLFLRLLRNSH